MGRRPDNRWQTTWAWFAQDTWKPTRRLTFDVGVRMYKWDDPVSATGEASAFSFERFDPSWGGRPPVLYQPVTTPQGRRARNPLTGAIVPVDLRRPDGAWLRLHLRRHHARHPVPDQRHRRRAQRRLRRWRRRLHRIARHPVRPPLRHGVRAQSEDGHARRAQARSTTARAVRTSGAGPRSSSTGSSTTPTWTPT